MLYALKKIKSELFGHYMNFTFCLDLFKPVVLPWSGFPGGSAVKNPFTNAGDVRLIPGFGKILLKRKWQPTPVFLPGESLWTEEPGGLQSMGSQIV